MKIRKTPPKTQPKMTPQREEIVHSAQILWTKLQKMDPFGDSEANLSYALLKYIRKDWQ